MKKKIFYVVLVVHNTGHGESADAICATQLPTVAIEVARGAEKLGYEFYSDEAYVAVYELKENMSYSKSSFKWLSGENPPENLPIILFRQKKDGIWKEEWFDKELEKLFRD